MPGKTKMRQEVKKKLDTKIIHSLNKGLEVLELVADAGNEASLSEITQRLKWDKSTIFRLLTTLIRRGYIEQDPASKRYHLGSRIFYLEQQLSRTLDLPRISQGILSSLARQTGENAHMATLQHGSVVIVAQSESPNKVAVNARVGMTEPLHCTALGKAVLMQLSEEDLKKEIAGIELTAYTPNTITSSEWLLKHIEKIRAAGYALDEEEYDLGVRCISAPVPTLSRRQVCAVGISGPASRMAVGRMPALVKHVQHAAEELSSRLGNPPHRSAQA